MFMLGSRMAAKLRSFDNLFPSSSRWLDQHSRNFFARLCHASKFAFFSTSQPNMKKSEENMQKEETPSLMLAYSETIFCLASWADGLTGWTWVEGGGEGEISPQRWLFIHTPLLSPSWMPLLRIWSPHEFLTCLYSVLLLRKKKQSAFSRSRETVSTVDFQ